MAGRKDRFDWTTFALYASLVVTGWLMLYAVGYSELDDNLFSFDSNIGKQTIWIGVSLAAFLVVQLIDARFWRTFSYPIYTLSLILLVAVLIFGDEIKGARSWIALGGFSFQPSELAKFATLLALSTYFGFSEYTLRSARTQATALGLILAPAFLILLQPDAGSAMVFLSFLILFFREGMPIGYYAFGLYATICLIAGLIFSFQPILLTINVLALIILAMALKRSYWTYIIPILIATLNVFILLGLKMAMSTVLIINAVGLIIMLYLVWSQRQRQTILAVPAVIVIGLALSGVSNYVFNDVLKPHQQDRINVWLQPSECDPQGALYNIIQSKVAIGSGGLTGKGFLQGSMTKLNFVPEQSTDFIFSTIGEEQGFLGSTAVILLFLGLILRILYIGERSENKLLRHFAYGLGGMLFFHFFVNIGMTMGLVPVVGIPLPFISKGGTALLSFTVMLSVFMKMAKSRF